MQLFLIAFNAGGIGAPELGDALRATADAFPQLDAAELVTAASPSGGLQVATVGHSPQVARPRQAVAMGGHEVVLFDGFPLDRSGGAAVDAAELGHRWDELVDSLEGQFVAVRADLRSETVEAVTDVLGISPLYAAQSDRGWILGNSVEALRRLIGEREPDPLGVSTFLAMGWACGGATLVSGVRALRGGHVHRVDAGGLRSVPYFTPAGVAETARARGGALAEDLAGQLVRLTGGLAGVPVECGLTAGRDTRLVMALLRAAGVEAKYGTIGEQGEIDVRIAELLAERLGLRHELISPAGEALLEDWQALVRRFVAQTDGLVSLSQVIDVSGQDPAPERLAVIAWGVGGEIGRSGTGALGALGPTAPLVSSSQRFQRRLLMMKLRDFQGLVRPEAMDTTRAYVDRFVDDRLAEGWPTREVANAFYTFERVARWGSTGMRRASPDSDLFSPFISRAFIRYCFSLTPGERYDEAAHYRLLTILDPELRDAPYEHPWKAQRPWLAGLLAARDAASPALGRLAGKLSRRSSNGGGAPALPFAVRWLDEHRLAHRELCRSVPDSPLWSFVDRDALDAALAAPLSDEAQADGVMRATTLVWYFHG